MFGKKATTLHSELMPEKKCPNCSAVGTTAMQVVAQYVHVYTIPFVPIGKKGVSKCQQCQETIKFKNMGAGFQKEYDAIRTNVRTPVRLFSGLGALIILIGLLLNSFLGK